LVSYNEDITTTQQQYQLPKNINTASFLDNLWRNAVPDANARREMVDAYIRDTGLPRSITSGVNSFSNRFYLQKALQASVAYRGQRDTFMFNAYNALKKATSGLNLDVAILVDGGSLSDVRDLRQIGAQGMWRHALSPRTHINTSFSAANIHSSTNPREDVVKTQRIALTHRFSRFLRGELELRHMHQTSTVKDGNVRENAASVALTIDL
ncbi:MAG TPA: TIGR03016 family PEP-CTERM system-associated outer membrane protein, partial [Burkholderiaceae bacterium]